MKLGILGSGMIAQEVLKIIPLLGLEKVYLYGRKSSLEKLEKLCEQYKLDGFFTDYQELLNSEIDTVYVALPNDLHYDFAKDALEKGKHVILEKPATSNLKELVALEKLANKKDRMLFEAVPMRYFPAFRNLREDILSIGRIRVAELNHSQYSSRYDAFRKGEILPALDYHHSGGALMDLNLYNVNAMTGLFGMPKSIEYTANIERGIDTSGVLVMKYPDFVAVCVGAKDSSSGFASTFQGEDGTIEIRNLPVSQVEEYRIRPKRGKWTEVKPEQDMPKLYYEFAAFKEMIEKNDWELQRSMMDWSKKAAFILDEARRNAGIVFDADFQDLT